MTDHADTIRRVLVPGWSNSAGRQDAIEALDALLAERQQAIDEVARLQALHLDRTKRTDSDLRELIQQRQQAIDELRLAGQRAATLVAVLTRIAESDGLVDVNTPEGPTRISPASFASAKLLADQLTVRLVSLGEQP